MNAARKTFEAARGTVTGKKEADAELKKFYQEVLPADFSAARRLLYPHLDQLARESNLSVGGSRFTSDKDDALGDLRKFSMTMNSDRRVQRHPPLHSRSSRPRRSSSCWRACR